MGRRPMSRSARRLLHESPRSTLHCRRTRDRVADYLSPDPAHAAESADVQLADVSRAIAAQAHASEPADEYPAADPPCRGLVPVGSGVCETVLLSPLRSKCKSHQRPARG